MAFSDNVKRNNIISIKVGTNWVSLPDPQTMQYEVYDLDSEDGTGRDQTGLMFRDRRAIKEKLTCTFPPMRGSDLHEMLSMVTDQFLTVRYWSPRTGALREAEMYVGNRTTPAYYLFEPSDPGHAYVQATSMNLIER